MAVKASFSKNGPVIANAYFKIAKIWGSKEDGLHCIMSIYYDNTSRIANADPINQINRDLLWDGTGNPYNLLYTDLKLTYMDGADI